MYIPAKNEKIRGYSGRPSVREILGPDIPALLRSGVCQKVKWMEWSSDRVKKNQVEWSGRSSEREQSGEQDSRKWSWAMSGKFCCSAPLACSANKECQLLVPPMRRCTLGGRAFPVAAARAWNALPACVRSEPSLRIFRYQLKTYLFYLSFPELSN